MVFSATIRESLEVLLRKFLSNTLTLQVEKKDVSTLKISHYLIPVKYRDKDEMLLKMTKVINPYLAIVFANKKEEAQRLYEYLKDAGLDEWKRHELIEHTDIVLAQNSGTKDISPWYVDNSVAVLLGAGWNNSVPNWFFNGSMDNVRFYKIALSSSEIATDKNNEYANLTTSMKDGLVAAYDFETINGNIVPDISGNNHNGTLVGYNFEFDITADNNYTGRGNKDEVLLSAKLLSPSDLNFSSISIDMTGTTNISDVEKIKVYQTSTSAFDSRKVESYTKLGEIVPDPSGQTTFSVTGSATGGNATYLWLTYDIASDAKEGNVVAAKLSSISAGGSTLQTVDEVIATREILLARKLLYAPGDHGSKNYRIPAIVTAKDGSLVVGTDKRKNNQGDLPEDIDVLINRSTNNGVDWSEPITIAQGTGRGAGFGDVGLVRTAEENGLLAIYVGGDGFFEPQSSNSKKQRIYVSKSSDNGVSWGSKVEITDQLYGPTCSVASRQGWQAAFVSSGAGLLTRDGTICFVGVANQYYEFLDGELRVIDYIKNISEYIEISTGRISASQMLERFLFTPDMQYSYISKLSGGEKRRLYLLYQRLWKKSILLA